MKQHKKTKRTIKTAFTLIELLVVITIIAILAGLSFPVTGAIMRKARETEAAADVSALVTAIKGYHLEYGRYPLDPSHQGTVGDLRMDPTNHSALMEALLGESTSSIPNAREIQFLEPKITSDTKGGYNESDQTFYDPWGTPYEIAMDSDYDKEIGGSHCSSSSGIRKGVIVWSFGARHTPSPPGTMIILTSAVKSWE